MVEGKPKEPGNPIKGTRKLTSQTDNTKSPKPKTLRNRGNEMLGSALELFYLVVPIKKKKKAKITNR